MCGFFKCWGSSRCFEICIEAGSFSDLKVQLLWSVWQKQEGCSSGRIFSLGFLHAVISYHSSQPCCIFSIRWEFDHLLFSPAFPFVTHLTSVVFTKGSILFFSFSFFFFFPHSCLMKSCVFTCFLCKLKHF